jgi:hypothetical protein
MELEQLYYLGELVGVVAIIGSLMFVGVQMRQSTHATRAASHHAITDTMNQANLAIAHNPEFAQIWVSGLEDRGSLNESQMAQFDMQLLSYFHIFDTMFYQARVGAGDVSLLKSEEGGIAFLSSQRGVQEWWSENPYGYSPEFRAYINSLRDEPSQGTN